MWMTVATGAGVLATALFVASAVPMLVKASRSRDLSSYSGGNLVIANLGNLAQTVYLTTVPPGPIWALHGFNTLASATMLTWWRRAAATPRTPPAPGTERSAGRIAACPGRT